MQSQRQPSSSGGGSGRSQSQSQSQTQKQTQQPQYSYHYELDVISDDPTVEDQVSQLLSDRASQAKFRDWSGADYRLISVDDFRRIIQGVDSHNEADEDKYLESVAWLSHMFPDTVFDWRSSWSNKDQSDVGDTTFSYYSGSEIEYDSYAYNDFLLSKLGGDPAGALYKEFLQQQLGHLKQ